MKYNIPITIEIPEFGKVVTEKGVMAFRATHQRRFKSGPSENDWFELSPHEIFYETIFGWGVRISIATWKVIDSELTPYHNKDFIGISETEYKQLNEQM